MRRRQRSDAEEVLIQLRMAVVLFASRAGLPIPSTLSEEPIPPEPMTRCARALYLLRCGPDLAAALRRAALRAPSTQREE